MKPKKQPKAVTMQAVADLFTRDIAELKRTQPGAVKARGTLEAAVKELRAQLTETSLRHKAARSGLHLIKVRETNLHYRRMGPYMLTNKRCLVAWGMTLADVADVLRHA